ncbi:MAG: tetratricopeptide repeat protein [Lachnospiraceae bacterium]
MDKILLDKYVWNYRNFGTSALKQVIEVQRKEQLGRSFYTSTYICPNCRHLLLKSNAQKAAVIRTSIDTNYALKSVFYCPRCQYLFSEAQRDLTLERGQVWFLHGKTAVEEAVALIDSVAVAPVIPYVPYCGRHGAVDHPQQMTVEKMTEYAQTCERQKNEKEAVRWYQNAAELGHPKAQEHLALRYWSGKGVEQSWEMAMYYWKLSAEQGNAQAQYELGSRYAAAGEYDRAVPLLQWAAEQGLEEARKKLEQIEWEQR